MRDYGGMTPKRMVYELTDGERRTIMLDIERRGREAKKK